MMCYGVPFINVQDLQSHTVYKGEYHEEHPLIMMFWAVIFEQEQLALRRFMQFLTGSERPPVFGFSKLESNRNNIAYFCIESVRYNPANPFPKAHTCFNRLELPLYQSEEQMREMLSAIFNNNLEGVYGLD
jgi:hypothetical protein